MVCIYSCLCAESVGFSLHMPASLISKGITVIFQMLTSKYKPFGTNEHLKHRKEFLMPVSPCTYIIILLWVTISYQFSYVLYFCLLVAPLMWEQLYIAYLNDKTHLLCLHRLIQTMMSLGKFKSRLYKVTKGHVFVPAVANQITPHK